MAVGKGISLFAWVHMVPPHYKQRSTSMVTVLIYDSSPQNAQFFRSLVHEVFIQQKISLELHVTANKNSIHATLKENSDAYDILLLGGPITEIQEICQLVRKNSGYSPAIAVIKNALDKSLLKYRVSGFISGADGAALIEYLAREVTEQHRFFALKLCDEVLSISIRRILYFENNAHTITLHIVGATTYQFISKLDELLGYLPQEKFIRCHQSILVNIDQVVSLNRVNRQLLLKDGTTLDVSRRMYLKTEAAIEKHFSLETSRFCCF